MRLEALSSNSQPSPRGRASPPFCTSPSNSVVAALDLPDGLPGMYAWCIASKRMRCADHAPMSSRSMPHVGCAEICTSTRAPARVRARPVSQPVESRSRNVITDGSGCWSMPSVPHWMLKPSNAATSLSWSLTATQPSPQSRNMKHCCATSCLASGRSRGESS